MQNMSVFTEYLRILCGYSEHVDAGKVTPDDYVEFRQLRDRISKASEAGYYGDKERAALDGVYEYIADGFRLLLHVEAAARITPGEFYLVKDNQYGIGTPGGFLYVAGIEAGKVRFIPTEEKKLPEKAGCFTVDEWLFEKLLER